MNGNPGPALSRNTLNAFGDKKAFTFNLPHKQGHMATAWLSLALMAKLLLSARPGW